MHWRPREAFGQNEVQLEITFSGTIPALQRLRERLSDHVLKPPRTTGAVWSAENQTFPRATMPEVITMNSPCEQLGAQSGAERSDFKGHHSAPRAGCTSANSSQRDKHER